MKILFWNARGLGGDRSLLILQSLFRDNRPEMVFLIETMCDRNAMEVLRVKLGFDAKLVVVWEGNSGGLCLLWKGVVDVDLVSYSRFHIDTVVTNINNKNWRMTGFYGHPISSQRIHGWTLLRRLASMASLPWIVGGDFNEILTISEKVGV